MAHFLVNTHSCRHMTTLILVIFVISLLILVHEWGHFYSARKLGVKVEEFGFGFPPKLFSFTKKEIRYSLNLLPLGGFVKIFGEHGEGEGHNESFISRPAWQRFVILVAGVAMNVVLAWIFFSAGALFGVPQISEGTEGQVPVSIVTILPESPAEGAGLKFGDQILELRSRDISLRVEKEKDIIDFADAYKGEEITMIISRTGEIKEVKLVPRANVPEGEGPIGIALGRLIIKRAPWYLAPLEGAETLFKSVTLTLYGFGSILKELVVEGKTSIAVSGPVGIFYFAEDSRVLGASYFLQFIGLLSVNLAILNFLPIPALDGGRILFLAIEKLRGARINPTTENAVHTIGFFILIFLMLLVTYKDIARIL